MAYKITHRWREQEVRFPNESAARGYANQVGGGVSRWHITVARTNTPAADREPSSTVPQQHSR